MNRRLLLEAAGCIALLTVLLVPGSIFCQTRVSPDAVHDTLWVNNAISRVIQALDSNKVEEAYNLTQKYTDSAVVKYGPRSKEMADMLELEVSLCDYWGVSPDLLEKAELCLKIREEQFGKSHPRYANGLVVLVHARFSSGTREETQIPLLEEALDILSSPEWRYSDERLNALNEMGLIYYQRELPGKAMAPLLEALSLEKRLYGEERYEYASLCSNIGNMYLSLARLQEAIEYMDISLQKTEKLIGKIHPDYCITLRSKGMACLTAGLFEASENSLLEALSIAREVYGPTDAKLLDYIWILADYYGKTANYNRMKRYVEEGFDLSKMHFQLPSEKAIMAFRQKGTYLEYIGDYNGATSQYEAVKQSLQENDRKNSVQYAEMLLRQGRVQKGMGNMKEAYELTQAAVSMAESLYPSESPTLCIIYQKQLLSFLETPEQLDRSYRILQRGIEVVRRYFGDESQSMATWRHYGSRIYAERGQPDSALIQLKMVYSILGNRISTGLAFMTFEQQEAYISAFDVFFNNMLELGHKYPADTAICSFLYDMTLFRKELLGFNSKRAFFAWRNSADSLTSIQIDKYFKLRQQAITIESRPVGMQTELNAVKDEIALIEKQLVRQSSFGNKLVVPKSGSWSEIRNRLLPDEAAVEYLMISGADSDCFGALILKSDSKSPELVLLGKLDTVNQYINNADGRAFTYAERVYGTGESSGRVFELIWKPLENHLNNVNKVYVAPAGGLFQLNFRALCADAAGARLGDRFNLVCLTSTRQLLDDDFVSRKKLTARNVLLAGGIDFETASDDHSNTINPEFQPATSRAIPNAEEFMSEEERGAITKQWEALPETLREVQLIDSILRANGYQTSLLTGKNATEAAFKNVGQQNWTIVHIASHGFFYGNYGKETQAVLPGFVTSSNSMLRSGLLLAGANPVWTGKRRQNNWNDGILTAEEVSLMDLDDVDLVTLSACETGLGEIQNYEGLFGFQRAFRIAGARNLIMTLWRIPDNTTRIFMVNLYANIAKGYTIRQAFESTVREMRSLYPAPYYWAGYILMDGNR